MASSKSIRCAQEPVTYMCLCNSEDNVNWYCNNCQEALCDRCKDFHSRGKKTKNDDIVQIWKADRQADKPVPEVCKVHPGKLRDLFCTDCEEVLCSVCVSAKYKQHNWKHLEQFVSTLKGHLNENMTGIVKRVELFKTKMSNLEREHKISTNNIEITRNEVNSQRKKLIAEVNNVADAVLEKVVGLGERTVGDIQRRLSTMSDQG
ncbi:transcription intermediary factor 1-beta-like [Argopecten irradians]|uniref:transcription intermediary factor 1-beta-like n=1 Tax=Argopecten irradians TaxID=31199 RepID=UPI00371A7B5D